MSQERGKRGMIVFEGKYYHNLTAAARYLGISRATFYARGFPTILNARRLGKLQRKYYAEDELNNYK